MKKQTLLPLVAIVMLLAMVMSSCNEDEMSQEDVVKQQQLIDLAIRIVDASDDDAPLDSAEVTISDGSESKSVTTDESGVAHFESVKISSSVPVKVEKDNYTRVHMQVNSVPNEYRESQITRTVQIYPLSGPNLATIQGRLTIETDVTNREREAVPEGTRIEAYNSSIANNIAFIGETDADGNYEIMVPVNSDGSDDIDLEYPEISAEQTLANKLNDGTITVEGRQTTFRLDNNAKTNAIPGVPSVYGVVDQPANETVGSGFAVEVQPVAVALNDYSQAVIVNGGSGYTPGDNQFIELSEGVNGTADRLEVDVNDDGRIDNIHGFEDNGAEYDAKPTINTNVLGGSGAEIEILFETRYLVYITNNGSGYTVFPDVFYTYTYYDGTQLREYSNDYNIGNLTDIAGGMIINDDPTEGDTITYNFTGGVVSIDFTIVDRPTEQAIVNFDASHINLNGQITGMDIDDGGYGYALDNTPALTLTSVAGYGSGADIGLILDNEGVVDDYGIINQGSGYVRNVNDFRDNGTITDIHQHPAFSTGTSSWNFMNIDNVNPGETFIRSAFYGTGTPEEDE